eukprot:TRINITY_DN897_c0_g1_i1.p1 TRINITY_DN897_c0_g1~~TRINITY_DN897_c0_g1_i1.p1  ORF type:complete len:393 (+),score=145.24 TRINITY_DN897_c0_g1_i1:90-1181(+)
MSLLRVKSGGENDDSGLIPVVDALKPQEINKTVDSYLNFHQSGKAGPVVNTASKQTEEEKKGVLAECGKMVNQYYDLATAFYEWGWGQSFHFAPRHRGEGFEASLARHEYYLALKLKIQENDLVLDVGCGVGGPLRNIARFAKCKVVGINNNQYQIDRGTLHNQRAGVTGQCSFVKSDFNQLPFADSTFDAVYQIEATAHAADKKLVFGEIFRVLKPGQAFGSYEWCLTDAYDPQNAVHRKSKRDIEEGNGLPGIATTQEVVKALEEVGFEVEVAVDLVADSQLPWYAAMEPRYTPTNFQHTWAGRQFCYYGLRMLETARLVPPGSSNISSFLLNSAAEGLVAGGKMEIFTPMFFTVARKPKK